MSTVNENSTSRFTSNPINEDGDAFTPDTARYRLDDITTGNEIIAWTSISPTSTEMVITIPASKNSIIDESKSEEDKVLTIETDFGTDSQHVEWQIYTVTNAPSPVIVAA